MVKKDNKAKKIDKKMPKKPVMKTKDKDCDCK